MLGHVYAHTKASIPTFMASTPFFKKKIAAATPESTCNVFLQVAPPGINGGLGLSDGAEKLQQIFTQLLTCLRGPRVCLAWTFASHRKNLRVQ